MEKYATYKVYKNKDTGEVKRVPLAEVKEESEKTASLKENDNWVEVDEDESYNA